MSEDFNVSYSCTTRWDETILGIRVLKDPPRERIDALLPIVHQLLQSEIDSGRMHICPMCGRDLTISIEYILELPDEVDISTDCRTCNFYVFFKSDKIPSWSQGTSIKDLPYLDRRE
jgi:hypothetical protein